MQRLSKKRRGAVRESSTGAVPANRQWLSLRRLSLITLPGLLAIVACTERMQLETTAEGVDGLHGSSTGVATLDTLFPQVVNVMAGTCSGTLIAPDTVLTASHCVTAFASKCGGGERALMTSLGNNQVKLSLDGTTTAFTANADATIVHPQAYIDLSICKSSDPLNCSVLNAADSRQLRAQHDLALIHLSGKLGGLPSQTTYPPLQVVTDIMSNAGGTNYTLHRKLNQATEFGPTQQVWACGEGNNDVNSGGSRYRGLLEFWQTSMGGAHGWLVPGAKLYSCNGSSVSNNDALIWVNRTSSGGTAYNGAALDKGDSGSPLLIQGGSGAGVYPEFTTGQYVVLGSANALIGAAPFDAGTAGPVPNGSEAVGYTPTFGSTNGSWLDQRVMDFDGDGFKNYEDNCPTVYNDQKDTNLDAEVELALPSFPTDTGTPPTDFSNYNAVTHFWQFYPGDACDADATTQGIQTGKVSSQVATGPCDTYQCQGCNCTSTSTGTCFKTMASVLNLDSWIGNQYGDAKTAPGTTKPAFCPCTGGTVQLCKNQQLGDCPIAKDQAIPFGNEIHNFAAISQGTGIGDISFPPTATSHLDPVTGYTPSSQQRSWDILNDFPALASGGGSHQRADKLGVLWSHVVTFTADGATNENGLIVNRNNHYEYIDPYVQNHFDNFPWGTCVNGPIAVPLWDPWQAVAHEVDWAVMQRDNVGAVHVMAQNTGGSEELTGRFTTAALSALSPLSTRAGEWIFADDLVTGALSGGPRAALVLFPGSSFPMSALTLSTTSVDGQSSAIAAPSPVPPVMFRSFSSKLDTLFDLRAFNGGFEAGDFSGWVTSGAAVSIVTAGVHSGTYAAMAGSTTPTNGDSNLAETFTAPSGATGLTFWYKMTCPDSITFDWAIATLLDNTTGVQTTPLAKICTTNTWTQVTASLTPGDSYTLTLTNHDDNYPTDATYTLFDDVALSPSGSAVLSLGVQPLAAEFHTPGTRSTTLVGLTGDVPAAPLAMAWNKGEGLLFVADKVATDANNSALRLLRMSTSGSSFELWRTVPVANTAFPTVMLSTSFASQEVLTVVSNGVAEMVTFDGTGNSIASSSLSAVNPTLLGAALVNPGGATWAYTPPTGGSPTVSQTAVASFTSSLCGAPWIKAHAAGGSALLVLGYNTCP